MPELALSPFATTLLVLGAIAVLYLARGPAHAAIRTLSALFSDGLRGLATALMGGHERLTVRNREILLAQGLEATERNIEREFQRVSTVVEGDLSGYPDLHRKLSDQIARIDDDYRESTDAPPSPPEWIRAVETIASIPTQGDPFVGRVLGDIHKTLQEGHKGAMRDYREASKERHHLLKKMLPFWRSLDRTLTRVDGTIRGLHDRSIALDRQMETYEQIRAKTDDAVRTVSASIMTHFVSSGIVLLIALLGGFINFHLIALPMSEMVGGSSYVGPVKTSDIAALVIVLTEIAMGLFLMESIRITRLFPIIGAMDDRMRKRMAYVAFGILLTLACVESSLAYMRDLLAADREALAKSLIGAQVVSAEFRWIPSIGQMIMGFMLPFALTFVAIPLESFIQSSRTVGGSLLALCIRGVAGMMRGAATVFEHVGEMIVNLYDVVIIVPLRIGQLLGKRGGGDYDQGRPTRVQDPSAV